MSAGAPPRSSAAGYRLVARAVRQETSHVFALPGDGNLPVLAELDDLGVRIVYARHESGAVSMAAGWSVARDEVGVASVTQGPGLTNAVTAITSAVRDRHPVVLYAGEVPTTRDGNPQAYPPEALVASTGATLRRCDAPASLPTSVADAFATAARLRTVVILVVPNDVLLQEGHLPSPETRSATPPLPRPVESAAGSGRVAVRGPSLTTDAARVAACLSSSERPVILAGRGALEPGAEQEIARIADLSGALLATTLPVVGLLGDRRDNLGICGGYALETSARLLRDADLVLALGASLNDYTTADGSAFPSAEIIQVDRDEAALGRWHLVTDGIVADVGEFVAEVRGHLEELDDTAGPHDESVLRAIESSRGYGDVDDASDETGIDPRVLLRGIDRSLRHLPTWVVVDVGHFSTFACQAFTVETPGRLLPCFGFGAVGMSLGYAVGVSAARPDDVVVAVVGDGGLMMSLPELESVVREAARLLVVVVNDRAYGAELHHLRRLGIEGRVGEFPLVDFASVANALGMGAVTVRSPDDLSKDELWVSMLDKGPVLVDGRVTRAVVAPKFR